MENYITPISGCQQIILFFLIIFSFFHRDHTCTGDSHQQDHRQDPPQSPRLPAPYAFRLPGAVFAAYLDEVQGGIPEGDLGLCENPAVDSVAGYFAMRYRECGIPVTFSLDLPPQLPVPESELCSVLSNLLENAMETGVKTAPGRRRTNVAAHLHSGHMVLLSVENTYDGKIREKDGVFLSSRRPGEGVGLQAVRHTAEKNGGYARFHYGDGVFTANVILRGGM